MGMFGTEFHLQKLTLKRPPGPFGKKNTLPETNSHFATDPEAIMGRWPTQKETLEYYSKPSHGGSGALKRFFFREGSFLLVS